MGINTKQLIELIIQPTLKDLNLYSLAAEQLLAGTCAQESGMGTYLKQVGAGPALGAWQMEKQSHDDIWKNYLIYSTKETLRNSLFDTTEIADKPEGEDISHYLIFNLKYACAMARIHYLRVKEPLPPANDIPALAAYYKKYYNTPNGGASEQQFIDNWNKYCANYYGGGK